MSDKSEDHPEAPDNTIEKELRNWPVSPYTSIAGAVASGQPSTPQNRTINRKAKRSVTAVILLLLLLGGGGGSFYLIYMKRNTPVPKVEQPPPPPTNPPSLNEAEIKVDSPTSHPDYRRTRAVFSDKGKDLLEIFKYDFFLYKFLYDNTRLTRQDAMVNEFREERSRFDKAWVIIFTAASVEGTEDYNMSLCSQRVEAVGHLMAFQTGAAARGYWSLLAGEYKMRNLTGSTDEEEAENEFAKKRRNQTALSDQRRLIVISIRELQPIPQDQYDQVPIIVAKRFYEQGHIPKDYDHSGDEPSQFKPKKEAEHSLQPKHKETRVRSNRKQRGKR